MEVLLIGFYVCCEISEPICAVVWHAKCDVVFLLAVLHVWRISLLELWIDILKANCNRNSEQDEMRISCLSSAFLFISKCQHSVLKVLIGRHLLFQARELANERIRVWGDRGLIESRCNDNSSGMCSWQVKRSKEVRCSRSDSRWFAEKPFTESPGLPNAWGGGWRWCSLGWGGGEREVDRRQHLANTPEDVSSHPSSGLELKVTQL